MKVPLGWLSDFLEAPTSDPQELEEILASLGHEVEGVENITPSFEGVVVARVEEVGPHPNADRIRFCRVNDGSQTREVVCGAWNFEEGAIVAYARPGSRLGLDSGSPLSVGVREIRGVASHGMIASARELGLGDDHEGIMVLDRLEAAGPSDVGRDFAEAAGIGDTVLDVSITPNRGDCMSLRGLARELAAYWKIPLRDVDPRPALGSAPATVEISIEDIEACPRFVGHEIDGVRVGPSPLRMQLRLLSIGQRPISNAVDVSNYVMWELGHPIHIFDAAKVSGRRIIIRRARPGEGLRTLDGADRELTEDDIVVADPSGPIALAGVMGGESTEVTPDTTDILVEAANWHPPSILFTSHRLGLRSEASARFERGADPNLSGLAAARAVELITSIGGGTARAEAVDRYPSPREPRRVLLRAADVSRLLGPEPDFAESLGLLGRLEFESRPAPAESSVPDTFVYSASPLPAEAGAQAATVSVPTYRSDVTRPADLVEEIARLYGYDRFRDRVRHGTDGSLTPRQAALRRLREALVGAGLHEVHTLSFLGQEDLDALRLPEGSPRRLGIRVKNPLREEESVLRTTLVPGLMEAVARNAARGAPRVSFFEIGRVFLPQDDPDDPRIPRQPQRLGIIFTGPDADVFSAAGLVEMLAEAGGRDLSLSQDRLASLHPGRGANVLCGGETIGFAGELHPSLARGAGLEGRAAVAELELEPLVAPLPDWTFRPVSMFPPLVFDMAFVLPESVPIARLLSVMGAAAGPGLEDLYLFDEFRGAPIPDGHRSLAVRVTVREMERTLTDEEAAPLLKGIASAVSDRLGGRLRGSLE